MLLSCSLVPSLLESLPVLRALSRGCFFFSRFLHVLSCVASSSFASCMSSTRVRCCVCASHAGCCGCGGCSRHGEEEDAAAETGWCCRQVDAACRRQRIQALRNQEGGQGCVRSCCAFPGLCFVVLRSADCGLLCLRATVGLAPSCSFCAMRFSGSICLCLFCLRSLVCASLFATYQCCISVTYAFAAFGVL